MTVNHRSPCKSAWIARDSKHSAKNGEEKSAIFQDLHSLHRTTHTSMSYSTNESRKFTVYVTDEKIGERKRIGEDLLSLEEVGGTKFFRRRSGRSVRAGDHANYDRYRIGICYFLKKVAGTQACPADRREAAHGE